MDTMHDFSKYIAVTCRSLAESYESYFRQIEKIASLHPYALILREKELSDDEYFSYAVRVRAICDEYDVMLFIHSHIDAARMLGCRNVHLSYSDFCDACNAAGVLDGFSNVSVSCHSIDEVQNAAMLGASQIVLGNIFETDCKKGLPGKGLDFLKEACLAGSGVPVYAIGGISPANIGDVLKAGAAGGCMMSGFMRIKKSQ